MSTRTEALSRGKKGNSRCISIVWVSAESLKITRLFWFVNPVRLEWIRQRIITSHERHSSYKRYVEVGEATFSRAKGSRVDEFICFRGPTRVCQVVVRAVQYDEKEGFGYLVSIALATW